MNKTNKQALSILAVGAFSFTFTYFLPPIAKQAEFSVVLILLWAVTSFMVFYGFMFKPVQFFLRLFWEYNHGIRGDNSKRTIFKKIGKFLVRFISLYALFVLVGVTMKYI
ncbi:hypothetical protein [Pseudomonas fluorescens]|uniref:hypothetical protein n=1 Tax=Pseudomonas fluorescens TaxID=294 RepID=UPI0005ABC31F|nr:hypothetical protein [Pseudomonas fluorescens]